MINNRVCFFQPPADLLDMIGFSEICAEMTFPSFSEGGEGFCFVVSMVLGGIEDYYRKEKDNAHQFFHKISSALNEAITNAAIHGNNGDPRKAVKVGLWLGPGGILLAIRDEGNFFEREDVKRLVESRKLLPSTRKPRKSGFGMEDIYKAAEVVRVCTDMNTLFLVIKR